MQGFNPWVRKIPWRQKQQPTPVLLPGKSHGQRSLAGYSPLGHKELDMTEQLSTAHNTIQKRFIGVFLQLEALTILSTLSTTPGWEWTE